VLIRVRNPGVMWRWLETPEHSGWLERGEATTLETTDAALPEKLRAAGWIVEVLDANESEERT